MIFLNVLKGERKKTPPLWLMRQAGRYLPEYQKLRGSYPSFLDLVLTPKAATEVTLQPIERFDFDAAIVFSDILVVPYALGQEVLFKDGIHMSELDPNTSLVPASFCKKISPVLETLTQTRKQLPKEKALIGFAGGPFTVLCYMLEGTNRKDFPKAREFAFSEKEAFHGLLAEVVKATILFLCEQIKAGADAVQIFESWAGLVPWQKQKSWIEDPLNQIIEGVRAFSPQTPVISFLKGANQMIPGFVERSKTTAISLDASFSMKKAQELPCVIQGNLDPVALLSGGETLEMMVENILEEMKEKPFIFNLGHGILPKTPVEHVEKLVSLVRKHR